jgi:mono/diheme cytochrome c family protein
MKTHHYILAAALVVGAVGLAMSAVAQDGPKGDAVNGKRIFLANGCFECHGRAGQGGAFNKPAPTLANMQLPFEAFEALVREPADDMPAYTDVLMPDKDLADVYAYLKSLPGPRAVKDIAILND